VFLSRDPLFSQILNELIFREAEGVLPSVALSPGGLREEAVLYSVRKARVPELENGTWTDFRIF